MCTLCRVILRLNLVPGLTATPIQGAIVLASSKLQVLEATLDLSTASSSAMALHLKSDEAFLPPIPHTPHAVESSDGNEFLKWGACVEALWRSCMELETKSAAWDALSTRMLLWRSIVGPQGSSAGEWARRQVVAIIGV
jgi:nucleolar pre-ribosomal-associated protein 1